VRQTLLVGFVPDCLHAGKALHFGLNGLIDAFLELGVEGLLGLQVCLFKVDLG